MLIKEWTGDVYKTTTLLYRATNEGFNWTTYTNNIQGKTPTVILIKSRMGNIFGGFTSSEWITDNNYHEDRTNFVFSLTHETKHEHHDNFDRSMYRSTSYFVVFGGCNCDFRITTTCNSTKDSYSNLGFAYKCPDGITYNSEEAL
jgi:hypothetical protein